MSTVDHNRLSIRRIRLINFHNFVDETIEIRHGGHLFLLGDNASGKTTILDAIHYVLTAGEHMELNSAARVAGSREGGRRVQGVILRYNVETGPLNPRGAITYVALELVGRGGTPTTIAIGMTARSMDDKVQRWGIVKECSLDEIPFLLREGEGKRPATRAEMKTHFEGGSGFYGRIGAYQREIAGRFCGGEELFGQVCRLLSMGKAYREIVSHTADYDQLFRRLLAEPRTRKFEEILAALKSLDQSMADLRALEEKCSYLETLRDLVEQIDGDREQRLCLRWLQQHLLAQQLHLRRTEYGKRLLERRNNVESLQTRAASLRRAQEQQQKLIDDLRTRDSADIIRREQELTGERQRLADMYREQETTLEAARQHLLASAETCEQDRARLRAELRRLFEELAQLAPHLPFPVTELIGALDAVHREEHPEDHLESIPLEEFRRHALEALRHPEAELTLLGQRCAELDQSIEALQKDLNQREKHSEAEPEIEGFSEAVKQLRQAMITATPLYMGLEWAPGLHPREKAATEELLGESVLATLMVPPEDFETARDLVFAAAPHLRLARAPAYGDLPDWFRGRFDIGASDPTVLICLAEEMLAHADPEVFAIDDENLGLRFRGHEERLCCPPPRLIGADCRAEAARREGEACRRTLESRHREQEELQHRRQDFSAAIERLERFRRLLDEGLNERFREAAGIHREAALLSAAEKEHADREEHLRELAEERAYLDERLAALRQTIEENELDRLEQELNEALATMKALREEEVGLHSQLGALDNQIKGLTESIDSLQRQEQAALGHQQVEATHLRERNPEAGDVEEMVAKRCGHAFNDHLEVAQALEDLSRTEGTRIGELMAALQHPLFGSVFGFDYDAETNRLVDRRNVAVADLAAVQRRGIEEQREIINQKTRDLFRRLIVEDLLTFLNRYVRELRDMVKRINRLLADREFGRVGYRFQIKEVDRYKRLIDIVEHYNPFEAEKTAEDIRQFFEDHHDELLQTEVNAVPDLLDYRNWFHYDMRARSTGGEGVVMDRRTKSIGSGGEQAVPNYLLILTIANFLFRGNPIRLQALIFDEAFYGIDAGRRDQLLGFATDLGLQLFVASPDQDGVKQEVAYSTTLLVIKDEKHDVHLFPFHWENPGTNPQPELLEEYRPQPQPFVFGEELVPGEDTSPNP